MPTPITVTMLVKNAERYLPEALNALTSFNEVLLLDNGSTDNTLAIAAQYPNVTIHHHPFDGFGNMKNRAAAPADMALTMHICRGNFRSTWFSSGGYEPIAEILFGGCHIDGFYLEYDSDRAGDFKPLRFIKNQQVVLGLVTSKTGELENKQDIIARIQEAAQYVDINQLCLSPQCGFASTEEGNVLTEEEQWRKLEFIREIAEEVWGK